MLQKCSHNKITFFDMFLMYAKATDAFLAQHATVLNHVRYIAY